MSHKRWSLDCRFAMQDGMPPAALEACTNLRPELEPWISQSELDAQRAPVRQAIAFLLEEARLGRLGFIHLPDNTETVSSVLTYAQSQEGRWDHILVLGIGGSSLGGRAIDHALVGPPELPRPRSCPRALFVDNSDPWLLSGLLQTLDPHRTLVLVISKSGGTVETAAQLLAVRPWLEHILGADKADEHLVYITDPEHGILRAEAHRRSIRSFSIPPDVGGRFSVLTPVGLVPAALCGIDIKALMQGAASMMPSCTSPELHDNPAAMYAAIHALHHQQHGRGTHVIMPYSDALRPFAAWFVQLWAESLGKRLRRNGERVESGPTPVAAIGATDQHAQGQLFMEGPRDKLVTFIEVQSRTRDLQISGATGELTYLNEKRFSDILRAQLHGTSQAFANDARPSVRITVDKLDAFTLGQLIYFFEMATAIAGELYGVNAFDQPGVEIGKRITFGLLGRAGYEQHVPEAAAASSNGRFAIHVEQG